MFKRIGISILEMLPATFLAGNIFVSAAGIQSPPPANATSAARAPAHSTQNRLPRRATQYYNSLWGVDSFSVKWVESGMIIRFSYRVLDANKATKLNDKKAEPYLIDPKAGVKLVVPAVEQVGKLRQTATPEAGKSYWMAFSNKGMFVKRGDRVSVEIGSFRVDGLVVQ